MDRKGHVFTEQDISPGRRSRMTPEQIKEWCETETNRWKVVATDPSPASPADAKIIAEELDQRAINKIKNRKVRVTVGTMMQQLSQAERAEVLKAFQADGKLAYPFKMVK